MPFQNFFNSLFGGKKKKKRRNSRRGSSSSRPVRDTRPAEVEETKPPVMPPRGGATVDTTILNELSETEATPKDDTATPVTPETTVTPPETTEATPPLVEEPTPPPTPTMTEEEAMELPNVQPVTEETPATPPTPVTAEETPAVTVETEPVVQPPQPEAPPMSDSEKYAKMADAIFEEGKKYIGTPYVYGGTTPEGFDCSGFVGHAYEMATGIDLPRTSRQQAEIGKTVEEAAVLKGDLVFFSHTGRSVNHVGIIVSEAGEPLTMIHASSSKGIIVSNLASSTYWKPRVTHYKRILGEFE